MGFFYRKSVRLGPFRVNLSKSGIGYSVGGPGMRTGVSARGRRYTNYNIPGTGLNYRTSSSGSSPSSGKGCLLVLIALLAVAAMLTSFLL